VKYAIIEKIEKVPSEKGLGENRSGAAQRKTRFMLFRSIGAVLFAVLKRRKSRNMQPKYKRVLLKLSGEALAGEKGFGLNQDVIATVVDQIVEVHNMGVEVGLVIGGGNFWRGRQGTKMERTTADHMGMLATVMNSLAMMDAIEQRGVPVRVQTALTM